MFLYAAAMLAYGVVLFVLVAGHFPFNHKNTDQLDPPMRLPLPVMVQYWPHLPHPLPQPDALYCHILQIKENIWFKMDFKAIPQSLKLASAL